MKSLRRVITVLFIVIFWVTAGIYILGNGHRKERDETGQQEEKTIIRLFSNLSDRTTGQGLLEQQFIDAYMKEHPDVVIQVEALQDEAYKVKFSAYMASDSLPDIITVWGQPAFIDPLINSGFLEELCCDSYEDYKFIADSTKGFSKNGRLYGLPRSTDIFGVYYNKQMFEICGLEVPKTMGELYNVCDVFQQKGIIPCAMAGQDKWPLACMYTDFVMKTTGDGSLLYDAVTTGDFSDKGLLEAAEEMKKLIDRGFFQTNYLSCDYASARNLFAEGRAAMFYMGSWEMGMASDELISGEIRSQIDAFAMPIMDRTKASEHDLTSWVGGGYAISAKSVVKEEAAAFLNYMFLPENWAKGAWQQGICIPAQRFDEFLTGEETPVQLTFMKMLNQAENLSGTPINDLGSPSFKNECEELGFGLAAGMKTPKQYIEEIKKALQ